MPFLRAVDFSVILADSKVSNKELKVFMTFLLTIP